MTKARGLAVFLVLILSGCGDDPEPPIATPPTVKPGRVVMCTDSPYEPFEFQSGSEYRGIDVDLMKAIAAQMQLQIEVKDVDFDSIFAELDSKNCDVVASAVSITLERQEQYLFSDGYFEVNQSLLVRAGDEGRFTDLATLGEGRVGVQKGSTGATYASANRGSATLVEFDDASEMVTSLEQGGVDAVVQDLPISAYLVQQNPKLAVTKTFTDVDRERYGFAMAKSSTQLQGAVNEGLERVRDNGEYDRILSRYLRPAE